MTEQTQQQEQILKELKHFTGSENFYKDYLGVILTDGIKTFCELCSCYWLITDTASVLMTNFLNKEDFIVIKIKVNDNKSAVVTLEDGNNNKLYSQNYKKIDFVLNDFEFWAVFNEVGTYTYMLKSEY